MRPTISTTSEIIELTSSSEDEKSNKDSLVTARRQLRDWKEKAKHDKKRLDAITKDMSILRADQEAKLEEALREVARIRVNQEAKLEEASREVARIRAEHDLKIAEIAEVFNALNSGHEEEMHSAAKDILRLQSLLEMSFKKNEELLELLECDICAHSIARPFTLKNCGHTFCYSCLRGWFLVLREEFRLKHPVYDPMHRFEKLNLATASQLAQTLAEDYSDFVHQVTLEDVLPHALRRYPHYSCPLCRQHVHSKPVEVYTLKAVIPLLREVGNSDHETEGQWAEFFDN
ncbi:hypothetical protein CPB83DRAFT_891895 [Crepidotus variabilis]|uniref:RING-type domain-containing protein n=1 Tax=Crepidotus variabilis TaxID=179855 RepID=A0A9P6EMX8_9AGAR|nr:hypothetical protein CPB83DRAFT_891895 [Crepidotus variabilis]